MRLYRWLSDFHGSERKIALAIGNFDGFHVGHQAVIAQMQAKARAHNLLSAVMIFEPQPLEFFGRGQASAATAVSAAPAAAASAPASASAPAAASAADAVSARTAAVPARLFTIRDKLRIFRAAGIDIVFCMTFTRKFAALSDVEFVAMLERMQVKSVTVGSDFSFGRGGAYHIAELEAACAARDIECSAIGKVEAQGVRISSTMLRSLIVKGDFSTAAKFMGRPYSIAGRVVHGNAIGRTIGFPTANINLNRLVCPLSGVYAVKVACRYGHFDGVANVGHRPTITIPTLHSLLEVNIFNFDADLYGQEIEVTFVHKIRDEVKFENLNALIAQISADKERAQYLLSLEAQDLP